VAGATRLRSGDTVLALVTGELDVAGVPLLRARVEREKQADAALVVDLRKLEFIDGSGLNVLLRGYCEQGERLRSVLGAVSARLVDVTGLRDKLSIIDEETRHG
jgi:anti-anti-sigma factor